MMRFLWGPPQAAASQVPQQDSGPTTVAEGQGSLVALLADQNVLLERILAAQVLQLHDALRCEISIPASLRSTPLQGQRP